MSQAERFEEPIFRSSSLQRDPPTMKEGEGEGEVELSLGLSLHGRFGVDPTREEGKEKLLTRSSSIPAFLLPVLRDQGGGGAVVLPPVQRTCSLPVETEEEWRKRKETQMLRRMEAKRKRSEKQQQQPRSLKVPCRGQSGSFGEESVLSEQQDNGGLVSGLEGVSPPAGVVAAPYSQGSIGSQGSGSSGLSESESLHAQGIIKTAGSRSPSSAQTPVAVTRQGSPEGDAVHNGRHNEPVPTKNEVGNMASALRNTLEEMPHVSTKGLGPNGKRLEGLLYGYRKGEETRILCVCHGHFFTPAEFVKHAGGDDVALTQPLKHIVVNVSPLL